MSGGKEAHPHGLACQPTLKPTTLKPANEVSLLARDATTGRALYVGSGSTVVLTEPGSEPRVVFEFVAPETVWQAVIDGEWMVVLTQDDVGMTKAHARRLGSEPFQVPLRGGDDSQALPYILLHNGTLFVSVISDPNIKDWTALAVNLATGGHVELMNTASTLSFRRWNDRVVLAQAFGNSPGKITAIDADTLSQVEVPAVLSGLGDGIYTASDGDTAAWASPTSPRLTIARQGWPTSRDYRLPGDRVEQLTVWGRYAVALSGERYWILDVETGQYAPLTIEWGSAIVSGGLLATSEMANAKGGSAGLREPDLTSVPPLPACTR